MSRISSLICFLCLLFAGSLSYAQVSATVGDDGFVRLIGSGIDLIGVDLMSEGGNLIPIPGDDPAPFAFLLRNEATQITYGNLIGVVDLDGELKLSAAYDLNAEFDLVGQWGATGAGNDGPIAFQVPDVPEPGSFVLMLAAIAGIGLFRRSRN